MTSPIRLAMVCCAMLLALPATAAQQAATAPIKALDAQQIDDYLAGRGMGMARAAELNGYPGPKHVLDLADQLELSPGQRERTEALMRSMQSDARALGAQLVEAERRLDRLFAERLATPKTMRPIVERIGMLQGALRTLHLETHLAQAALLAPDQIDRYNALRGNEPPAAPMHHPNHHH